MACTVYLRKINSSSLEMLILASFETVDVVSKQINATKNLHLIHACSSVDDFQAKSHVHISLFTCMRET